MTLSLHDTLPVSGRGRDRPCPGVVHEDSQAPAAGGAVSGGTRVDRGGREPPGRSPAAPGRPHRAAARADRGGQIVRGVAAAHLRRWPRTPRSEEHTSELQSLMRISYAVFGLKQKTTMSAVLIQQY